MIKKYLIAYNLTLAVGWCIFLGLFIANKGRLDAASLTVLNICQVAAVLEIMHAWLKWVNTPVSAAGMQVFSRIFVLVFINILPEQHMLTLWGLNGISLIALAWSVTEVVRYSFYFISLLGKDIHVLTYLRYTLFIVLYPVGVTGEWMILLSYLRLTQWEVGVINGLIILVMLSYLPFFPRLYLYMWGQRKKKLQSAS
ncbi:MAG: hypothetical protein KatS3mg031_2511 [Chitinophagales bacterium]|nr:MAG: hypothetical protein KatS3mg031_2511 [Chitinophagales bacterium]